MRTRMDTANVNRLLLAKGLRAFGDGSHPVKRRQRISVGAMRRLGFGRSEQP